MSDKLEVKARERIESIDGQFKEVVQQETALKEQLTQVSQLKQQLIGEFNGLNQLLNDEPGTLTLPEPEEETESK